MTAPNQTHLKHSLSKQSKHEPSKPNIEKLTFRKWYRTAIITYLIICLGAMIAIYLAEREIIHYDGPLPGFTVLMIASIVYFWLMRRHFRWFYMIFFCIETFIILLFSMVFVTEENTTPIMDEMTSSLLASSMLFPFIIWIPYTIMSYVRKEIHNN